MGIIHLLRSQKEKETYARQGRRFLISDDEKFITVEGAQFELLDISRRGASLRYVAAVAVDDRLNFEISDITGLASVRWVNAEEGSIGIQFMNVRFDDCRKMARHQVSRRETSTARVALDNQTA